MINDALFITGTHRSGTTILDRLLNQLPGVSILSQPFPLLFVDAKRAFLRTIGFDDVRYPLGHLFHDDRYDRDAFAEFLRHSHSSPEQLRAIFSDMRGYSGQYTRFSDDEITAALARISDVDDFSLVVQKLNRALSRKADCSWFGSKETICEEFLPPMLDRGVRCVLIIRDPRDVTTSLNHGRGIEFGGMPRPFLFNIRSWRKSVAHALALEEHPRFAWCRYEDLVREPEREVTRLAVTLGVATAPVRVTRKLREADGSVWLGNSSHRNLPELSDVSVGGYKTLLDPRVQRLIEATCLPELRLLGYETTITNAEASAALGAMSEPWDVTRTGMENDFVNSFNIRREIRRLAAVRETPGTASVKWFLFEKAHARLRQAYQA
jgi:hypothetical protein